MMLSLAAWIWFASLFGGFVALLPTPFWHYGVASYAASLVFADLGALLWRDSEFDEFFAYRLLMTFQYEAEAGGNPC